jgi:hypothetical protein
MAKERVQNNNAKKLFALLTVIVALSLVVNLLSLNVLYGITETRQSAGNGELNSLSSWWKSLWDPYYGYSSYEEYSEAAYQKELNPPTEEEPSAAEQLAKEVEEWGDECTWNYQCSNRGKDYCDSNSITFDRCEKGYCKSYVSEKCDSDEVCTDWWYLDTTNTPVVLEGVYECMDSAASDYTYEYEDDSSDSSGSYCSGNADCPSTACFDDTRLFGMACMSGKCDYTHKKATCQYGCSDGACNLS